LVSGCTKQQPKKPLCIIHPTSKDSNISTVEEPSETSKEDDELKIIDDGAGGSNEVEDEYCIVDVFTDSLFLDGNRIKLIQNLDALPWEKKALLKAYKDHKKLWSKQQKKEFQEILEEDKYLSLCGDRRYYDNLLFTVEEPQVDILHSILLLKYLNNLSHGCKKWVLQKSTDENNHKTIPTLYLLGMIEKDALVERLFIPFVPQHKSFQRAVKEYKKMKDKDEKSKKLKEKRIEIEQIKEADEYPSYKN
jgi:murein L,D-transpeptidase YcbB/YkuD